MPDPSDQKSTAEDLSKKESLLTGRERMLNQAEQGFFKKATELNKKEDLINTLSRNNIKSSEDLRIILNNVYEKKDEPTTTQEDDMEEEQQEIQEQNTEGDLQETLNNKLDEMVKKVEQATGPAIMKQNLENFKINFDREIKQTKENDIPYSKNYYKRNHTAVISQYLNLISKDANKELTIKDYLSNYNADMKQIGINSGILQEDGAGSDLSLGDAKASSPEASGKAQKPDLSKMSDEEKEEYFIKEAMKKK